MGGRHKVHPVSSLVAPRRVPGGGGQEGGVVAPRLVPPPLALKEDARRPARDTGDRKGEGPELESCFSVGLQVKVVSVLPAAVATTLAQNQIRVALLPLAISRFLHGCPQTALRGEARR